MIQLSTDKGDFEQETAKRGSIYVILKPICQYSTIASEFLVSEIINHICARKTCLRAKSEVLDLHAGASAAKIMLSAVITLARARSNLS